MNIIRYFLIVLFISTFTTSVRAGLGKYCGDWVPIDWFSVPKAQPEDVFQIYYLASPLLYCDYEDDGEYINGYHGAVAFLNTRTGKSWNLNYDAWPTFPGAIVPHILRNNDTVVLNWTNFGGVFIYEGINKTYWHTVHQIVATMNGAQFNAFVEILPQMNATMPYYDPWNVYKSFPDVRLFAAFECFQWAFVCLAEVQRLGGKLVDGVETLQQSLGVLYSDSTPVVVNASDPTVLADITMFYETLEGAITQLGVIKFFEEILEIALSGRFYIYDNTNYYLVQLKLPYFEIHWYPMKVPIVPPNGTYVVRRGWDINK